MDCPSTPAEPLFAVTRLSASDTSLFEICNDLSFGSDLLTRLLPGQRLVARAQQITDEPAPSLRFHYRSFSATTSRSASVSASVLNASQFLLLDALPLTTHHPFRAADRRIGTRLPTFRVAAADQTRATFTPDSRVAGGNLTPRLPQNRA